jgi:hypothetical protein
MSDPLALSALGGVAATEGIKFLYEQAAELLRSWRERRGKAAPGEALPAHLTVPIVDNHVLDATPVGDVADVAVLDRVNRSLVQLVGALAPYAAGLADIDPSDEELSQQAGAARALLEEVYGQRFTFRSEQRESTGTRVTVTQVLGDVAGAVVGAEATAGPGSVLAIEQDVSIVRRGGSVTGFKGGVCS